MADIEKCDNYKVDGVLPSSAPPPKTAKTNGKVILVLFFLFLAYFCWSPVQIHADLHSVPHIDWQPCREDPAFLCGYLEVPTDYFNASAGTSKLALTNYPATCPESQRLGIIITNHGGPGVPGRDASFAIAPRIQHLSGNRHDIISFDQRGLGHSLPKVNCFGSALNYELFRANTVFESTFSVPKDPFSAAGRAVLIEQQKEALALEQIQGTMCAQTVGAEALGYMSTTTTVYDMEEISRVLVGEDALINFYLCPLFTGSIVGAYLGNMLPHKAGKIMIDGIVPGDMWSNEHYDSQALLRLLLTDAEKTYQLFLEDCAKAGPTHCALANVGDKSSKDIEARIDAFIDKLQEEPMPVSNYTRPGFLTSGGVRSTLHVSLQMPEQWKIYAQMLASAMNEADGTPLLQLIAPKYSDPWLPTDTEGYSYTGQKALGRLAISCGDARAYGADDKQPTAEDIVDNILETLRSQPRFGATVHLVEQHGGCHLWPGTGVGPRRFTGPWNVSPAKITDDPITPYAAGKIVHETMRNSSRLLVQGAAGHSWLSPTTNCAAKVLQQYFADGIIPEKSETWCE
ncbi:hypothetical protein C8J57DRAFT_1610690, partial [Mycena rebaudengoi]